MGVSLCYGRGVADDPVQATVYDVVCPHCGKSFRDELLTGSAERYHGFKCPHCRLFVPLERVAEQHGVEPVSSGSFAPGGDRLGSRGSRRP